jgi:outer membrane protein TolC
VLATIRLTACAAVEIESNPAIARPRMTPAMAAAGEAALAPTSGTLRLTVAGAIALALDNNRALKVDRINPALRQTFVAEQRSAFDPVLTSDLAHSETRLDQPDPFGGATGIATTHQRSASLGLNEFLPSGTNLGLALSAGGVDPRGGDGSWSTRAGISISQSLLRGAGPAVNLVSLRQARLDARSSQYELRGFTESLAAQVENAYWDHLLARRQLHIFEDAMTVARQQLDQTLERIRVGTLADTERYSAEAEVAQRREALINARSQVETTALRLQRLVSPAGDTLAPRPIELMSDPILPAEPIDVADDHLALARRMRPELNQARLALARDELEIVRTRNGLLPDLELFINLGQTGYARSFSGTVDDLEGGNSHDYSAQLSLTYPLGNRAARARARRASLTREQQVESIANLDELVEQDVRGGLIEVRRVREQVAATSATRALQEQTLRAEQDKFSVGRSTSLSVAQAERDLLSAQIAEVQAAIAYLKSIVNLYLLDGSLLVRRGIDCPGEEPVEMPEASRIEE